MNMNEAWNLVKKYSTVTDFPEEEMPLIEEAFYYILNNARELYEKDDFLLWQVDIEAGAFNLADYYEKIGKYELAIKYYELSEEYGCTFAKERIERIMVRKNDE